MIRLIKILKFPFLLSLGITIISRPIMAFILWEKELTYLCNCISRTQFIILFIYFIYMEIGYAKD